jgi:two-component sensor histidine kinase
MNSGSTLFFSRVIVVWGLASNLSLAQGVVNLKLQPEQLQKAQKAEREARAKNDSLSLAEAWYLYGKMYVNVGDYRASQGYFLKSLQLLEPKGDSFELSRIYVRLSENEGRLGRHTEALRYARLSLQVAQQMRSDKALGRAYGAVARVYENTWNGELRGNEDRIKRILWYHRQEESIYRKLNDTLGVGEASVELGTLLARIKDRQAIFYFSKALDIFTHHHKEKLRANVLLHLASAYLTFGQPDLALKTLTEAEQAYKDNKEDKYDTALSLENEYVLYYQTVGQWKQAFEHLQKVKLLETSQLKSDRDGTIAQLNVAYETSKKEALLKAKNREIILHTENLQTQRLFTLIALGLLVGAIGLSILFFRLYRKNQRISRRNEELLKEQNHRVKNNLQVVSSLLSLQSKRLSDESAKRAVEESRLRVQSMAILHRKLYDGNRLAEIDLTEFVPELTNGVLKAFGYPSVQVQYVIDDIMLAADKAIPLGLILNELITNACKYAFPDNERPELSITCRRKGNKLVLTVADNGPGLEGASVHAQGTDGVAEVYNGGSFGMTLIQAQTEQLYGTIRFGSQEEDVNPTGSNLRGAVFTLEFKI